jgi:hypothetical protein
MKNYNSNDGFLTTVWGPAIWHYLHTVSFNYPVNPTKEDKINYRKLILNLKNTLPCGKCRINLRNNLNKLPLTETDMKSRDTFSLYVYNLHETINTMLNKKSGLSYKDVRERYEHFRARCSTPEKTNEKEEEIKKTEKGCVEPIRGEKSKCVITIVPQTDVTKTFVMDKRCYGRKK